MYTTAQEFLASPDRIAWVETGAMSVYMRKSRRYLDGQLVDCVDLASFSVPEHSWNQGLATRFVVDVLSTQPKPVYIESILSEAMEHIALKLGFLYKDRDPMNINMYRKAYLAAQ